MNTAHLTIREGCALDETPSGFSCEMNFTIVNIANKLYARCDETHHTLSSEPKTKSLYDAMGEYWRSYVRSKGYAPIECSTLKHPKKIYQIAKMRRTLAIRSILINAGVLKK